MGKSSRNAAQSGDVARHIIPSSRRAASESISRFQGGSQTRNTAGFLDARNGGHFRFDVLLQDRPHPAAGRRQRHFDFDPISAAGQRLDLQIINQAQDRRC